MGGKHATSTSAVTIPPEVLAHYNEVWGMAKNAATKPFQSFGSQASDYVAPVNAQQNAGIADINATAGSYQPYMDAAKTATMGSMGPSYEGIDKYMSPYIQNVADTTGAMMQQSNEQAQSGALGAAAASGAFGGDRAGVAAANLNQQNQMAYGKTMADIYNQGYGQAMGAHQNDLQRQMAGGQQLAGLGAQSQALGLQGAQAKIGAGTLQQQNQQAGIDAMAQRFMQQQGYDFQTAQYLANIAMGTGALSGSTTTSKQPLDMWGNPYAEGGKVDGYADGGGVAGPRTYTQSQIGSSGYVPEGDLPVGHMMIAEAPKSPDKSPEKKDSTGDTLLKILNMSSDKGMATGGVAGGRHGYATDGSVSYPSLNTEDLRRQMEIRDTVHGLAQANMMRESINNSYNADNTTNPSNVGLAGHTSVPQALGAAINPLSRTVTLPSVPDQPTLGSVPAIPTPSATLGSVGSDQHPMARPSDLLAPKTSPVPQQFHTAPTSAVTPAISTPHSQGSTAENNGWAADSQTIRQRESGNDYDALLGFSEKGNGPFSGTKVTDMTVDQAIAFSSIGSPYANYSKSKLGYTATPMGAYQILGSTLADAKKALGLTGNEKMTPELQDSIAKYLYDTRGTSPWSETMGGSAAGGLGKADMSSQTPYGQRNPIGQFFHNPDGTMNQSAISALLSGLAGMTTGHTLASSILRGLGAGSEAYKTTQTQQSELQNKNIENTRNAMQNWQNAIYNGMTQLSWPEYAKQQGIDLTGTSVASTNQQGQSNIPVITSNQTRGSVLRDGVEIPFMQDYQSLNMLLSQNSGIVDPTNPMYGIVQQAKTNLQNIEKTGYTYDINGKPVKVNPVVQVQNAAVQNDVNRKSAADFYNQSIANSESVAKMSQNIGNLEGIFQNMEAGPLAAPGAVAGAVLQGWGIDTSSLPSNMQNPAGYYEAVKNSANLMANSLAYLPGGAPATELNFVSSMTPNGDMPPAAARDLIINMKAVNDYQRAYYSGFPEWQKSHPDDQDNVAAYQADFAKNSDDLFKSLVKKNADNTPHFKGQIAPIDNMNETLWNTFSQAEREAMWKSVESGDYAKSKSSGTQP